MRLVKFMNSSNIRTFIAIVFPVSISSIVRSVINQLSVIKGQISWVKDHSAHLTLKFLGETSPDKLEQVKQALERSVSNVSPFNLHLTELGVFPNNRQPRVIWWGIKNDTPQLLHLYQNIEKEMNACGFELENRPFSPHLTLGRIRELNQPQQLIKLMSKIELPTHEPIQINQVQLIQSNLGRQGATYTPLASFSFNTNS